MIETASIKCELCHVRQFYYYDTDDPTPETVQIAVARETLAHLTNCPKYTARQRTPTGSPDSLQMSLL